LPRPDSLKQFIAYIVTQGQSEAETLSYAKLAETLQQQDQALLAQVGTNSQAFLAILDRVKPRNRLPSLISAGRIQ
jgi:hypothetical protein